MTNIATMAKNTRTYYYSYLPVFYYCYILLNNSSIANYHGMYGLYMYVTVEPKGWYFLLFVLLRFLYFSVQSSFSTSFLYKHVTYRILRFNMQNKHIRSHIPSHTFGTNDMIELQFPPPYIHPYWLTFYKTVLRLPMTRLIPYMRLSLSLRCIARWHTMYLYIIIVLCVLMEIHV